jgi:hypothetical protein
MAKEKEVKSSKKKIIIWTLSIIGILVIAFILYAVFFAEGREEGIDKIGDYYNQYSSAYDLFSTEYEVASPSEVSGGASLSRALGGIENARPYVDMMKGNLSESIALTQTLQTKYTSGDKALWLSKSLACDQKRLEMVNLYAVILTNEESYFLWYNESSNFDANYEDFLVTVDSYLSNEELGNEQAIINDLNKMKTQLAKMNKNCVDADKYLSFVFVQKYLAWTTKYSELVDLLLQYYSSPSTDLEVRISTKAKEAGALLDEATSSKSDAEFDKWWTEEVTLKKDSADRLYNEADSSCSAASELYATAFPANANVIKDINQTA